MRRHRSRCIPLLSLNYREVTTRLGRFLPGHTGPYRSIPVTLSNLHSTEARNASSGGKEVRGGERGRAGGRRTGKGRERYLVRTRGKGGRERREAGRGDKRGRRRQRRVFSSIERMSPLRHFVDPPSLRIRAIPRVALRAATRSEIEVAKRRGVERAKATG